MPGRVLALGNLALSCLVQVQDRTHVSGWYSGKSNHWVTSRCVRRREGCKPKEYVSRSDTSLSRGEVLSDIGCTHVWHSYPKCVSLKDSLLAVSQAGDVGWVHAQIRVGELADSRGSEAEEGLVVAVGVCMFYFRCPDARWRQTPRPFQIRKVFPTPHASI